METRAMATRALAFEKAMIEEGLSSRTLEEIEEFYSVATFKGVRLSGEDS
jgi:hypothetical protein